MEMKSWIVVSVDGQAASGKGTISRILSERFQLRYLDTGKLYRALTYYLISRKRRKLFDRDRPKFLSFLSDGRPSDEDLQSEFISRHTPEVANQKWARAMLLEVQREFANTLVDGYNGAILDGRDIGTVVCPDADVKLFVSASLEERAKRRQSQLHSFGENISFEKIRADLATRDARDSNRLLSPLKAAEDAFCLDTSNISVDQAIEAASKYISSKITEMAENW